MMAEGLSFVTLSLFIFDHDRDISCHPHTPTSLSCFWLESCAVHSGKLDQKQQKLLLLDLGRIE
jgi:hypothetical protein